MRSFLALLCLTFLFCAIPARCDDVDDDQVAPIGDRYPDGGVLLKKLQSPEFRLWREGLTELTQLLEKKGNAAAFYVSNDVLSAALTRNASGQGDSRTVSYPQAQFIKALVQYRSNLPLPFIRQLIDLAGVKRRDSLVSEATISALAIRSDEAVIHYLMDRAITEARNDKKQSVSIFAEVLLNRGWNLVPQIFSYFQTEREPLAAQGIAPILISIIGKEMADAILESRIDTSKDVEEREGLAQLRAAL